MVAASVWSTPPVISSASREKKTKPPTSLRSLRERSRARLRINPQFEPTSQISDLGEPVPSGPRRHPVIALRADSYRRSHDPKRPGFSGAAVAGELDGDVRRLASDRERQFT